MATKFNSKRKTTKTKNRAGGTAFKMGPKLELAFACLSTFLEDKFYESGDERVERIKELASQCPKSFVGKLAIYCRTKANMRSVSTVLLGELARDPREGAIHQVITSTISRPDDMTELVSYLDGKLPNQVKRGLRNAILKFDPYQLAKYRGETRNVKLVDVFNLTHPKAQHASAEQKEAWAKLINGELTAPPTWEVMSTEAKTDQERRAGWEELILENKLGYMALLRNLNNFVKYNIGKEARKAVIEKLTDRQEVKKSKQLPFRFWTAYQNVKGDREFTDAIITAADYALDNVPVFEGKTLVAVDMSGSMLGGAIEKAALFAAALIKANSNADLVMYDTSIHKVEEKHVSTKLPTLTICENIIERACGGGTHTSLVLDYADGKGYDQIVILSDNESWCEHLWSSSPKDRYNAMMVKPTIIAIDIQGYGTTDLKDPKVFHLNGWSDRVFETVGYLLRGGTLIDEIENSVQ